MKKLSALLTVCLLTATLAFTPGCKTVTNPTTGVTTSQLDPMRTSDAIRLIVSTGVPFAIQKDRNCVPYLRMVETTLILACDSNTYDPEQLTAMLNASSAKELKTPEAQAAINAAIGVYRIYFGDVVSAKLSQSEWVKPVLKGIIGGLNDSLPKS